jgi:3',5'-cyclic AMP phosphodiesterase CpdA
MFFAKAGINNFTKRFPYAGITGYSKVISNTAVVLFNSNFNELSNEEIQKQLAWYKTTLDNFEADSTISFIIVGCHHSPFTNSKIVSPSTDVQTYYLPYFFKTSKCKLFISGHAHAFEHFKIKGKDFLVIGGGGGIQQTLYTGKEEKYKDLFDTNSDTRMFHFIIINISENKLIVRLEMLNKDFKTFNSSYNFSLNKF